MIATCWLLVLSAIVKLDFDSFNYFHVNCLWDAYSLWVTLGLRSTALLTSWFGFSSISIPSVGRTGVGLGTTEDFSTSLVTDRVRDNKETCADVWKRGVLGNDDSDDIINEDEYEVSDDDDGSFVDTNDCSVGVW